MGEIRIVVGKTTTNEKPQAFNQIEIILGTKPTLNTLITKDIMHERSKAIKNEKTNF